MNWSTGIIQAFFSKKMRTTFLIPLLILLFCSSINISSNYQKNDYQVGQVWSYKTRPNEEQSTFTVVLIERDARLGPIIHISINGLKLTNPVSADMPYDTIAHMPFSEKAIDKS